MMLNDVTKLEILCASIKSRQLKLLLLTRLVLDLKG